MIRILIEVEDPDGTVELRELDTLPPDTSDAAVLASTLRLIADRFDTFSALKQAVGDVYADMKLNEGDEAA